jgi:hypothetical protein
LNVLQGKATGKATTINSQKGPYKNKWLLILLIPILTAIGFFLYRSRKSKITTNPATIRERIKYSELIENLNAESLSEKSTCLEIQKILTAAAKEFPGITNLSGSEWKKIQTECQLLVYSGLIDARKKLELKQRAYHLLKDAEENNNDFYS